VQRLPPGDNASKQSMPKVAQAGALKRNILTLLIPFDHNRNPTVRLASALS
jgi:hypothetical protein